MQDAAEEAACPAAWLPGWATAVVQELPHQRPLLAAAAAAAAAAVLMAAAATMRLLVWSRLLWVVLAALEKRAVGASAQLLL